MAVLGRLLVSSAERLDLPDLLSIDSYAAGDWKFFLKGLVGDSKPYILKGFDVIDPGNAIGTQSCSIRVADSVTFYPGSGAGSFYHGLNEGHPQAVPLVPELRKNAVNYVYLTFSTFNTSVDSRAFWDPDKDAGAGGEFTQDINTESVLDVQVNVSTGSFPANTIPIAKITVGPVVITAIEDARDLLFRLGTGGINPNPLNTYTWRSLPGSGYKRTEPPTQMLAGGVNPFQGADKNILNLKEWMDVVMSKLRELGGSTYWYDDISSFSIVSTFFDALATTYKSKGQWVHDSSIPGLITWTEDIQVKLTSDLRTYIIRQGNKTLANEQVMYIPMVRNQPVNVTDEPVSWTSGALYVNTIGGAVGLFINLAKGDYVRKVNDSIDKWLRVEEFYDGLNAGGSTTSAALARSIRLSSTYLGTTGAERGRYDKGAYLSSDVVVSSRDSAAIANAGGNFHWLAIRSDTIENVASIVSHTLSLAISEHDGATAKVVSTAHGLVDNDRITISGTTNFNGTFKVEVETANIFYITLAGGPFANESGSGFYGTVTTAARSTPYGFQEESASHGFRSDDSIIINGTTNYNSTNPPPKINVIDATSFTIPLSAAFATETTGTATMARIVIRDEGAGITLVQGQTIDIGSSIADNIRQFVGMNSLSELYPSYSILPGYNTLDGMQNYNGVFTDNLTARVSKLTAMMADKAQDKTVKHLASGLDVVNNTTNGSAQEITFLPSGATLTILQPGSTGNAVIALPDVAPGISLLANQSAYISIDRNSASAPTIVVANTSSIVIDENIFVLAARLSGTDVWMWDGTQLPVGSTPLSPLSNAQDRNSKLTKGGVWSWSLAGTLLTWTLDAYVQVPGVADSRNRIPAGSTALLDVDGKCLYVTINRTAGVAATLSLSVADIASVPNGSNTLIIARRIDNDVMVGNGTILLIDGESKGLEAGLSVQNRALLGSGVTEATSNPGYAARGAVNRITSDSEGALDAIARHDAEIDKLFGQFRIITKTAGNKRRARITGSDRVTFTGETLAQEMGSLRVSFTGAEIDFATGSIYGGDATLPLSTDFSTPLGINFTPATITASQYLWYSIAANPSGTNADNTVNVQFNVLAGLSGSNPSAASKPAFGGLKHIGYVVVKDDGLGGSGTILTFDDVAFTLPAASAQSKVAQLGIGTGTGGGSGLFKVNYHDPLSVTLPTGAVTEDGTAVIPGDLVLFSNLSSGNNKVYKAVGSIGNITSWQPQFAFGGSDTPTSSDTVIVQSGTGFANTVGVFTGTTWSFNNKVRYFNGADYWEVDSIQNSSLLDNVSNTTLFSIAFAGSENIIADYSVVRGSTKEIGTLHITTNGLTVAVSASGSYIGSTGTSFDGIISGSNLIIRYTTTATGSAGSIKYYIRRWSNTSGGPGGGPPSYSGGGGGGGSGTPGGGTPDIQFNSGGTFAGNSNFGIDTIDLSMNLNGLRMTPQSSVAILDNIVSPSILFTYSAINSAAIIEYSIVRGTAYRTGKILVANDGTIVSAGEDGYVETTSTGVTLSVDLSGGNVRILYISTITGSGGTFKYSLRRWS